MKLRKIFLVIGTFLAAAIILSSSQSDQKAIFLDKENYGLYEIVQVHLNYSNFKNTRLEISSQAKKFVYPNPVNIIKYVPSIYGTYNISFFKDSVLIDSTEFHVISEDMERETDFEKPKIVISTDKQQYDLNELIVIMICGGDDFTGYELEHIDNQRTYKFFDLDSSPIRILASNPGKHLVILTRNNEVVSETSFYVNGSLSSVLSDETKKLEQKLSTENKSEDVSLGVITSENVTQEQLPFKLVNAKNQSRKFTIVSATLKEGASLTLQQKKLHKVIISIEESSIKRIEFNNLNVDGDLTLGLDEIDDSFFVNNKKTVSSYALDPAQLSFEDALVTVTARGTELWKCKDWNFAQQACLGSWVKIKDITPGKNYSFLLTTQDPGFAETGIATVNTNKPIYHTSETAEIIMVVLDNKGHLVDNAEVHINITTPNNITFTFATQDNEVIKTQRGIYEISFSYTNTEGNYSMFVTAVGNNVNQTMSSYFFVKDFYEFDIIRETPAVTDPWRGAFESKVKIVPFNYEGEYSFTEVLPSSFEVSNFGDAIQSITGNSVLLTWTNLQSNSIVSYTALPPKKSPELYAIGPSYITYNSQKFYEARSWYLAIDPTVYFRIEAQRLDNVGENWIQVNFSNAYYDPIVIATLEISSSQTPSDTPTGVRITNVSSTSVEIRAMKVSENGTQSVAPDNTVFLMVAESGYWDISGFPTIEAGEHTTSNIAYKTSWTADPITMDAGWAGNAEFFHNPVTTNDLDFIETYARGSAQADAPTVTNFNLALNAMEIDKEFTHSSETVHYIVIERTSGSFIDGGGRSIEYSVERSADQIQQYGSGNNPEPHSLSQTPAWGIVDMIGEDGGDGHFDNWEDSPFGASNVVPYSQEDVYRDTETTHTAEEVSFFIVNDTFYYDQNKPPNVTSLNYPPNGANISSPVDFNFTVVDDFGIENCSLYMNISGWTIQGSNSNVLNNTNTNITISVPDGRYRWNVKCIDDALPFKYGWHDVNYTITADSSAPNVTNLQFNPSSQIVNLPVNITVDITEFIGTDAVIAKIVLPNSTQFNLTMSDTEGDGVFNLTFVYTGLVGQYNVTILANDTLGSLNDTVTAGFNVSLEDLSLVTDKPEYVVGEMVYIFGTGFNYTENITLVIYNPTNDPVNESLYPKDVISNLTGGINDSWYIPTDQMLGTYRINATDKTNPGRSIEVTFEIVSAIITTDQSGYEQGNWANITGYNWDSGVNVTMNITDENGRLVYGPVNVTSNASGWINDSWFVPYNATIGDHIIAAYEPSYPAKLDDYTFAVTARTVTLSVDYPWYKEGEQINITGTGFSPNANITINIFNSTGQSVSGYPGDVTSNSTGHINCSIIMSGLPEGTYTINATDQNYTNLNAYTTFEVVVAQILADKSSYNDGETVYLTGSYWDRFVNVTIDIVNITGQSETGYPQNVSSNITGGFDHTWVARAIGLTEVVYNVSAWQPDDVTEDASTNFSVFRQAVIETDKNFYVQKEVVNITGRLYMPNDYITLWIKSLNNGGTALGYPKILPTDTGGNLDHLFNISIYCEGEYTVIGTDQTFPVLLNDSKNFTVRPWWNSSWEKRRPIMLTNPDNEDYAEIGIELNITGLDGYVSSCMDELRIISTMTGQIINLNHLGGDDSTYCEVRFIANISANAVNESNYYVYYNNSQAAYPNYTNIILPYGTGKDGDLLVSSLDTIINNYTFINQNQSAGSWNISVNDSSEFSVGDEILLIQVQNGTTACGAGDYEFHIIKAICGNNLTLTTPIENDYCYNNPNTVSTDCTDTISGFDSALAQVVKVPHYRNVTVQSSASITAPNWTGYEGGILVFRVLGNTTVFGEINVTGRGFRGGQDGTNDDSEGGTGEGIAGWGYNPEAGDYPSGDWEVSGDCMQDPNGIGGAGSWCSNDNGGDPGAGGGYGTVGQSVVQDQGQSLSEGGVEIGYSDLSRMYFGGGGGAGSDNDNANPEGDGGRGGGIIYIVSKNLDGSIISSDGHEGYGDSGVTTSATGGGGAGGTIWLSANNLVFQTVSASGGLGGDDGSEPGGIGGNGRIRLDYNTKTGTSNPNPGYEGSAPTQYYSTDVDAIVGSVQQYFICEPIDAVTPNITVNSPPNYYNTTDSTPEINFTITDDLDTILNYTVFIDYIVNGQNGTVNNGTSKTLNISTLTQGPHTILIEGKDDYSNAKNSSVLYITIDYTGPSTNITDPINFTNTSEDTYTVVANAADQYLYVDTTTFLYRENNTASWKPACNDHQVIGGSAQCIWDLTLLTDGDSYQLRAYSNDTLGNVGDNYTVYNLTIDRQGPISNLTAPVNYTNITSDYNVVAVSSDLYSGIDTVVFEYRENSTTTWKLIGKDEQAPYSSTWHISSLPDGNTYQIRAYANDTLGNIGNYDVSYNITLDRTPPNIQNLQAVPSPQKLGLGVDITANITDLYSQISNVEARIVLPNSSQINLTMTDPESDSVYNAHFTGTLIIGMYNVTIFVNDSLGNSNISEKINFAVEYYTLSLSTDKESYIVQETVYVVGRGFSSYSNITVNVFNSTGQSIGVYPYDILSNATGDINNSWYIPFGQTLGAYTINATDKEDSSRSIITTFDIVTAVIESDKWIYQQGEMVNITGYNWDPGFDVTINITDQNGQLAYGPINVTGNASGWINHSWFSDYNATLGVHTIYAYEPSAPSKNDDYSFTITQRPVYLQLDYPWYKEGQQVNITGFGFSPYTNVTIKVYNSTGQSISDYPKNISSNNTGAINNSFTINNLQLGNYTINASDIMYENLNNYTLFEIVNQTLSTNKNQYVNGENVLIIGQYWSRLTNITVLIINSTGQSLPGYPKNVTTTANGILSDSCLAETLIQGTELFNLTAYNPYTPSENASTNFTVMRVAILDTDKNEYHQYELVNITGLYYTNHGEVQLIIRTLDGTKYAYYYPKTIMADSEGEINHLFNNTDICSGEYIVEAHDLTVSSLAANATFNITILKDNSSLQTANSSAPYGSYNLYAGPYVNTTASDNKWEYLGGEDYGQTTGNFDAFINYSFNISELGLSINRIQNLSFKIEYCHSGDTANPECNQLNEQHEGVANGPQSIGIYNFSGGSWLNISELPVDNDTNNEQNHSFYTDNSLLDCIQNNIVMIRFEVDFNQTGYQDDILVIDFLQLNISYGSEDPEAACTDYDDKFLQVINYNEFFVIIEDTQIEIYNFSNNNLLDSDNGTYFRYLPLEQLKVHVFAPLSIDNITYTIFDLNYSSSVNLTSEVIENYSYTLPSLITNVTSIVAVNDTLIQYNKTQLKIPTQGLEVNTILHCLDFDYSNAQCQQWELDETGDFEYYNDSSYIYFNVSSFDAFGGGPGDTLPNLTSINIYNVTGLSGTHKGGTLIGQGLNETFYLTPNNLYRAEFVIINDGRKWIIGEEDTAYHNGLNQSWDITWGDIWYVDGANATNFTGGNFSNGKVSWNLSLGGTYDSGDTGAFYYVVNITTTHSKNYSVYFYLNDTSKNSGSTDNSAYFVRDIFGPGITLNNPGNEYNFSAGPINFNWTAKDNGPDNLSCDILINDVINQTNITSENNVPRDYSVDNFKSGKYNWSINCTDTSGNFNISDTINFTVIEGPFDISISISSDNHSIDLNWSSAAYAISYNLYIITNYSQNFSSIPNATGITDLNWTDSAANLSFERYYKIGAVRGSAIAVSDKTAGMHKKELDINWNLLSIPFEQPNWLLYNGTNNGRDIFTEPGNCLISLWRLNASNQSFERTDYDGTVWLPATGSEKFTGIEPARGYWFETNQPCNVTFVGVVPEYNISVDLKEYFNVVGWFSGKTALLGDETIQKPIDVAPSDSVWIIHRYDEITDWFEVTVHWSGYGWVPAWNNTNFTSIQPFKGYYFDAVEDAIWNLNPEIGT
ncbi:hypothetical protein JW930_07150 [Candidatus Woesearchaeota archaeon]|nr:hypothetical protein [Candidatus Woesearchaeota archaeon]